MSMSAGHLESTTTRESVETSVGTLECRDRLPTADTAQPLYHRLDFARGGEAAFLSIASIHCMRQELLTVGGEENLR